MMGIWRHRELILIIISFKMNISDEHLFKKSREPLIRQFVMIKETVSCTAELMLVLPSPITNGNVLTYVVIWR